MKLRTLKDKLIRAVVTYAMSSARLHFITYPSPETEIKFLQSTENFTPVTTSEKGNKLTRASLNNQKSSPGEVSLDAKSH